MHESRGNETETGRAHCEKGQGCCRQERAVSETDERDQGRSCATCEISGNEELLTAVPATYQYDPIVSIEYIGERPVYDIEVVGTHNFILANGLCSYNCQDINNDFIPVLEECCSASDYGIMTYLGTAKHWMVHWRPVLNGALRVIGVFVAITVGNIILQLLRWSCSR